MSWIVWYAERMSITYFPVLTTNRPGWNRWQARATSALRYSTVVLMYWDRIARWRRIGKLTSTGWETNSHAPWALIWIIYVQTSGQTQLIFQALRRYQDHEVDSDVVVARGQDLCWRVFFVLGGWKQTFFLHHDRLNHSFKTVLYTISKRPECTIYTIEANQIGQQDKACPPATVGLIGH